MKRAHTSKWILATLLAVTPLTAAPPKSGSGSHGGHTQAQPSSSSSTTTGASTAHSTFVVSPSYVPPSPQSIVPSLVPNFPTVIIPDHILTPGQTVPGPPMIGVGSPLTGTITNTTPVPGTNSAPFAGMSR